MNLVEVPDGKQRKKKDNFEVIEGEEEDENQRIDPQMQFETNYVDEMSRGKKGKKKKKVKKQNMQKMSPEQMDNDEIQYQIQELKEKLSNTKYR